MLPPQREGLCTGAHSCPAQAPRARGPAPTALLAPGGLLWSNSTHGVHHNRPFKVTKHTVPQEALFRQAVLSLDGGVWGEVDLHFTVYPLCTM